MEDAAEHLFMREFEVLEQKNNTVQTIRPHLAAFRHIAEYPSDEGITSTLIIRPLFKAKYIAIIKRFQMEEFNRRVDVSISRLLRAYRHLLEAGEISPTDPPHAQLLVQTSAAELKYHCQSLLDQIHELRIRYILDIAEVTAMEQGR